MIENDNPFDSPDFADLLPEMVHFCGFAHPCPRRAGPEPIVQGIVYESVLRSGRLDRGRLPGGVL